MTIPISRRSGTAAYRGVQAHIRRTATVAFSLHTLSRSGPNCLDMIVSVHTGHFVRPACLGVPSSGYGSRAHVVFDLFALGGTWCSKWQVRVLVQCETKPVRKFSV